MANYINHQQARQGIEDAIARRKYNNSFEGSVKNTLQNALRDKIGLDTLENDQKSIANRLVENIEKVKREEYVDPKEYDSLVAEAESVGKRLGYLRNYLRNADPNNAEAIKEATDASKNFLDASKAMAGQQKFYSAFKDANDYKKQMDAYKEQQRLTFDYDLNAGKSKLDAAKGTKEYDKLKAEYETAKYFQDDYKYEQLKNKEDFADKSKKAKTKFGLDTYGEGAWAADYINGKWYSKFMQGLRNFGDTINFLNNDELTERFNRYDFMTDDQVDTFNYIFNTEGQDAAQKYLDHIESELAQKYIKANKTDNWFVNTLRAVNAGTESIGEGLDNFIMAGIRNSVESVEKANGKGNEWTKYWDEIIKENAAPSNSAMALEARKKEASGIEKFWYDVAQTAPNTLVNMFVPFGLGLVITSLSAAGNAYAQATIEEKSTMERSLMALGEGSMEAVTNAVQKLGLKGIEKLGTGTKVGANISSKLASVNANMSKSLAGSVTKTFAKYGYHMFSEGLEEGIQEIASTELRNAIYGENNELDWGQIGYNALLGAASAGILQGGPTAANVYRDFKLPPPTESHFKETFDTAPKDANFDTRYSTFMKNLDTQDSAIAASVIMNAESGNTEKANEIIDDAIKTYEFAKEYNSRHIHADNSEIDARIAELKSLKKHIANKTLNIEAAKTAATQGTALWQVAAENNDAAAKVLLQKGLSNTQIENTVLSDPGTQRGLRRLTGVILTQYKTVSQKRNAVKNAAEAYQAFAGTDAASKVNKLLKINNTLDDSVKRSENRTAAVTILNAESAKVKQMADAERNKPQSEKDTHKIDVLRAEVKVIDAARDAIIKNSYLNFASLDGSNAVNNATNATITKNTKKASAPKAETAKASVTTATDDLSAAFDSLSDESKKIITKQGIFKARENVDGKIAELEKVKGKDRDREAIKELKSEQKKLEKYDALYRSVAAEARAVYEGKLNDKVAERLEQLKPYLEKYGVNTELELGEVWYTDENGNILTEEEGLEAKKRGETVFRRTVNGRQSGMTVFIMQSLAKGQVPVIEDGKIVYRPVGLAPGMIPPSRAVDMIIGHELVHFIKRNASSEAKDLYKKIISNVAGTKYDGFEIGRRFAGTEYGKSLGIDEKLGEMKVSKEAEERWNNLKKLYVSAEMNAGKSREEAAKIVTDDYILEEIAADYMANLFESDGIINTVNAQVGFWRRIIDHLKNLGKRLNTEGLERSKQVDLLAKRLESAVNRVYGKEGKNLAKQKETEAKAKTEAEEKKAQREADKATAKANREAQKSTETNEKVEDEQTVTDEENGAETLENAVKMSASGEYTNSIDNDRIIDYNEFDGALSREQWAKFYQDTDAIIESGNINVGDNIYFVPKTKYGRATLIIYDYDPNRKNTRKVVAAYRDASVLINQIERWMKEYENESNITRLIDELGNRLETAGLQQYDVRLSDYIAVDSTDFETEQFNRKDIKDPTDVEKRIGIQGKSQKTNDGVKFSVTTDSEGRPLTEAQQEFFKDSKVRDENGNLKVMYHGTQKGGFYEFDPNYSDDDISLFFVDRNDVAMSYSGTSETYAPKAFKTSDEINNFFAEIGKSEYEVAEKDGKYTLYDDGDEVATSDNLSEIFEEFKDWEGVGYGDVNYKVYLNLTNPLEVDAKGGNWNEIEFEPLDNGFAASGRIMWGPKKFDTREIAKYAKEQGYDGVIFKNIRDNGGHSNGSEGASTVAIAFVSNQVKSVGNDAPTSDPNIRYSLSAAETDKLYLEAVKRGDMETAQQMVYEAAQKAGYTDDSSWKMQHSAPNSKDDVNLVDLKESGLVPDDYWDHPEWYTYSPEERESFYKVRDAIQKQERWTAEGKTNYSGKPLEAKIWVYRAVDKTVNAKEDFFRNGDWVTPSYNYAVNEGKMNPNGYRIIKHSVSIKDLYWDGNSIAELGYDDGKNYAYADTLNNRKSLDAVTYDNYGMVIPLSKRFKFRNSDTRYSLSPETDSEYLTAVENGDMETAQRMVDEAAKAAGYDYHLYHGTNADFTKFDLRKYGGKNGKGEGYGIYLAANREISAPYGKNVIDSYTKFNRLAEGNKKTLSYAEVKKLIKRSCELEAQRAVDDGEYDSISEAIKDTWVSNYVYTYEYSNMSQVYAEVANILWENNDNDGEIINEMMASSGAHYDYDNALDFYNSILTPTTGIDGFHYIWGNKDGSGVQNDIYLAFSSEQIKSADPVTYDDNGNVIPLSERFNEGNEDIRYSLSGYTADGIEVYETNKEIMNMSEADRKKHYLELVKNDYRGRTARFQKNGHTYYAGIDIDDAKKQMYGEKRSSKSGSKALVRTLADGSVFDLVENAEYYGGAKEQGKSTKAHKNVIAWDYFVKTIQIDGKVYDLVADVKKTSDGEYVYTLHLTDNTKIKAAPAQTRFSGPSKVAETAYDNIVTQDESVVNTQSMQNSEKNTDGRNSVSEAVETDELSYDELKRQLDKLQKRNVKLASEFVQTHGKEVDPDSAKKVLSEIIEKYQGTIKAKDIQDKFEKVFEYSNTKNADANELLDMLNDIASDIFDSAIEYDQITEEQRALLAELRETGITVSEIDRSGDFDDVDGWNEFRKKNIGRVKFVNNGTPIDSYYQELVGRFPELFDEGITHPADQAKEIVNVAKMLREIGVTPKGVYDGIDEQIIVGEIIGDLYGALKTADKKQTFADKAAKNISDARLAEQMHYGAKIEKLKQKNAERVSQIIEKFESRIAKLSEKQRLAYDKKMAYSRLNDISKALFNPTKKKHIPEDFRNDVAFVLRKIKLPQNTVEEIEFRRWFKDQIDKLTIGAKIDESTTKLPPNIYNSVKDVSDFNLASFDAEQMHEFSQMLRSLSRAINAEDKLFHSSQSASKVALAAIRHIELARKINDKVNSKLFNLPNWIGMSAWDPEGLFNYIGIPELTEAYRRIAEGQNVYAQTMQDLAREMGIILGAEYDENGNLKKVGKIPKEWREQGVEIRLDNGKTLNFSKAQIMTLYLLDRQADSKKRLLNENGGIELTRKEIKQNLNGKLASKLGKLGEKVSTTVTVLGQESTLTQNDLDRIFSEYLDEDMKKVAAKISALLNGEIANRLNEISLEIDGYKRFGVDNYFPMMVSDSSKNLDFDGLLQQHFEALMTGKSFTFDRTGTSGVKLVVDDIFNVIDRHILGVSQYIGYEKALRDFMKIYNGRYENSQLKHALTTKLGSAVPKAIDNFIMGMQGRQMKTGEEALITEKIFSNYKAAAVALNMSVVAKQPFSIIRAMPEFSSKGIKAMAKMPKKSDIEEMLAESGPAKMKQWGFSENTTAKTVGQLYDDNALKWRDRMNDLPVFNLAEKADIHTWARIWIACRAETNSIEEAREKFNDVIRKTQVVNTATTASHIANVDFFRKMVFAFKNEPLKTFNYTRAAVQDVIRGKEGAGKHLTKVLAANAVNTAIIATITTMFSMMRDDEDDDLTFEKVSSQILENALWDTVTTATIFMGDVVEAINSGLSNRTVERADLSVLTDSVQLINKLASGKLEGSGKSWAQIIYEASGVISSISGLPIKTVLRSLKTTANNVLSMIDNPYSDYIMEKVFYDVDSTASRSRFREILTEAIDKDYATYAKIKNDLVKHGYSQSDIDNAVKKSDRFVNAWNKGYDSFKAEIATAQKYDKMITADYVMPMIESKYRSLITALFNAMLEGKGVSKAKNELLAFTNPSTKKATTEKQIETFMNDKLESALRKDVENILVAGYGTPQYKENVNTLLEKYKAFEKVTPEYIDKLAKKAKTSK